MILVCTQVSPWVDGMEPKPKKNLVGNGKDVQRPLVVLFRHDFPFRHKGFNNLQNLVAVFVVLANIVNGQIPIVLGEFGENTALKLVLFGNFVRPLSFGQGFERTSLLILRIGRSFPIVRYFNRLFHIVFIGTILTCFPSFVIESKTQHVHRSLAIRRGLHRVAQPRFRVSRGETNHGFERTGRNRQRPLVLSTSHFCVSVGNEISRTLRKFRSHARLGEVEIFSQKVVLQNVIGVGIVLAELSLGRIVSIPLPYRMHLVSVIHVVIRVLVFVVIVAIVPGTSAIRAVTMTQNHVVGNHAVRYGVHLIEHNEKQIETR
mmetsp:Transcript_11568/g.27181  ORF Transcript_11568/g.27181 Transcript_11568/m.27181 type:complete len:318 (+) Transcript_11568:34-987(+)